MVQLAGKGPPRLQLAQSSGAGLQLGAWAASAGGCGAAGRGGASAAAAGSELRGSPAAGAWAASAGGCGAAGRGGARMATAGTQLGGWPAAGARAASAGDRGCDALGNTGPSEDVSRAGLVGERCGPRWLSSSWAAATSETCRACMRPCTAAAIHEQGALCAVLLSHVAAGPESPQTYMLLSLTLSHRALLDICNSTT